MVQGISLTNRKLLARKAGNVTDLFEMDPQELMARIPELDADRLELLRSNEWEDMAVRECTAMTTHGIEAVCFLDADYPFLLTQCKDAPLVIYKKGKGCLNEKRVLAVVGTRRCTRNGVRICEEIVAGLAPYDVAIVSGLAYGIDIVAHRAALKAGITTYGMVAHGLDTIYPPAHKDTAVEMLEAGGVWSEYVVGTPSLPAHFPERNRIVAGCADAVLVVESPDKGGSLITAGIANSYNREVMAIPGRPSDDMSIGCNRLIRTNHAHLVTSAEEIALLLNWNIRSQDHMQLELPIALTDQQQKVVNSMVEGPLSIDEMSVITELPQNELSATLLGLEFEGVVRTLPGKVYELLR